MKWLCLLLASLIFWSCGPSGEPQSATTEELPLQQEEAEPEGAETTGEQAPEPSPSEPSQADLEALALQQPQGAPPIPVPEGPPPGSETPAATPSVPAATPSFLRGREFLISDRTKPSYPVPKDTRIGALWSDMPVRTQDPEVGKLFRDFLGFLSKGEIRTSLIAPAWLSAIRNPIQEVINQGWPGPAEWRLGELFWETDTLVRAAFLLQREDKWAAGFLYAEPVRGVYKVTDVVADLAELSKEREAKDGLFEPDAHPILSPLP